MGLQPRGGSLETTAAKPLTPERAPLDDMYAGQTRLRITVETRRYGKPVTVVSGFGPKIDIAEVARLLKRRLGVGGGAKNGRIELQGDHAQRLGPMLGGMGFLVE